MNCETCGQKMLADLNMELRTAEYYCDNYDCKNGPYWVLMMKSESIKYAHELAHLLLRFEPKPDDTYGIDLKNRVKKLLDVLTIGREIRK